MKVRNFFIIGQLCFLIACSGGGHNSYSSKTSASTDSTPPSVTINQKSSVTDPATTLPVSFEIVFSEEINISSFTISDISNSGTAEISDWEIISSGDGKTFTLVVNSTNSDGTIIPTVTEGSVTDLSGNGSLGATSTDNSVELDTPFPFIKSLGRKGSEEQNTILTSVVFTAIFDEAVSNVDITDFSLTTTGSVTGAAITAFSTISTTEYEITVSGISGGLNGGDVRVNLNDVDNDIVDVDSGNQLGQNTRSGFETYTKSKSFVSTWNITSGDTITLPLPSGSNYNFHVNWGDTNSSDYSGTNPTVSHTYGSTTTFTITIDGLVEAFSFNSAGNVDKIITVEEFGNLGWKNLDSAFKGCTNLTSFSGGDTSDVTNMVSMFDGATSLSSLNVSTFDTSKVTLMTLMFYNLSSLSSLNLSNFNTSEVTDMFYMFSIPASPSLTSLNVSSFDTSKVTDMSSMFEGLSSLTELNISSFTTPECTDIGSMFKNVNQVTSLDLSGFNTIKVTDMEGTFFGMTALTALNLSSFDTREVLTMRRMFYNLANITTLSFPTTFTTAKVTDMSSMFSGMTSLSSLDLSNFDTAKVTTMDSMFYNVSSLTSLNLSNFHTPVLNSIRLIFYNMNSLSNLDITNFNTSNVTDMDSSFSECSNLTSLNLSHFDTSKVTDMQNLFYNTSSLTSLNTMGWDINPAPTNTNIFSNTNAGLQVICDQGSTIGTGTFFGETCTGSNSCPTGFIPIPGDSSLSTSDFCVMKYEAKCTGSANGTGCNDASDVPVSQVTNLPWRSTVDTYEAFDACARMSEGGFSGSFRLMSTPEWMTISRNVEQQEKNWSSGIVGTGHIPRGHSDDDGTGPLALTDSTDRYNGTGQSNLDTAGSGWEQKRALYLSNNNLIWDFAGNVWELTDWSLSDSVVTTAPLTFTVTSWTENTTAPSTLSDDEFQSLLGVYDSNNSFGQWGDVSNAGGTLRGGAYNRENVSGIYAINFTGNPSTGYATTGFRCVYIP